MLISAIYIYPIKSLGGISLKSSALTDRGLEYDRRWMLVDANNRFLSQREHPEMALLQVSIGISGILVHHKLKDEPPLHIPFTNPETAEAEAAAASEAQATAEAASEAQATAEAASAATSVTVWDDTCTARAISEEADRWFTKALDFPCRLVYMPDTTRREVDPQYAQHHEITSFSDGYPLLVIGQASLDDLNARLDQPLPMDRFRPNLVFTGGHPFQEDEMQEFEIAGIKFFGVKPCARCVMTLIDQATGERGKEPLRTLSKYRQKNNKILFGQNLLFQGRGRISIGDKISVVGPAAGHP